MEERTYEQIASLNGFVAGLCCDRDAEIYACDIGAHKVLRVEAGSACAFLNQGGEQERWLGHDGAVL